jgi:hypothetical protein
MNWSKSRSGTACGLGIARAVLLLFPLALAACGSVVVGSGASSAGATGTQSPNIAVPLSLCTEDPGAVNHLVVTRTGVVSHVQDQRFTFPAVVTVTSAAEAGKVAAALCALPRQPAGITNCPADFGIVYQLRFAAAGHHFHVVKLQTSGCEVVSGAGKPRTIVHDPAFWGVLGKAMLLHAPVLQRAFAGVSPGGRECAPASAQLAQAGNCPGSHQRG